MHMPVNPRPEFAGKTLPRQWSTSSGPFVAGEDHQGVLRDLQLLQQVEQRAEVGVQLEQAVGPIALDDSSMGESVLEPARDGHRRLTARTLGHAELL